MIKIEGSRLVITENDPFIEVFRRDSMLFDLEEEESISSRTLLSSPCGRIGSYLFVCACRICCIMGEAATGYRTAAYIVRSTVSNKPLGVEGWMGITVARREIPSENKVVFTDADMLYVYVYDPSVGGWVCRGTLETHVGRYSNGPGCTIIEGERHA